MGKSRFSIDKYVKVVRRQFTTPDVYEDTENRARQSEKIKIRTLVFSLSVRCRFFRSVSSRDDDAVSVLALYWA